MEALEGLVLRPGIVADRPFIAAAWFKSFQKHAPEVGFDVYKAGQGALIDRLLERSAVVTAAVELGPDLEELVGFVAWEGPAIHYVYVKQAFRRLGIGARLLKLPESPLWHTHETHTWRKLSGKPHTRYNPYLLVNP